MRGLVAVTGAGGRLGRALMLALAQHGIDAVAWSRPAYDLDEPDSARRLLDRDRPATVIHAAAWTDVDGAAAEPAVAMRRNAVAVSALATACAARGAGLVLISTNEVFDGARNDRRGYRETDPTNPINAYGASKLAGETAARDAFDLHLGRLWVVRTAWLFGPPGNDFPAKILAAADRLEPGASLPVVADEVGSPTHTGDLAGAIVDLLGVAPAGTYHLAGDGNASRLELAQAVLDACRPGVTTKPISRHQFARRSEPPGWAVLDCSLAASYGVAIRDWRAALAAYAGEYLRPMALGMAR